MPPAFARMAPWCHRILTPLVVSRLPGPVPDRFLVVNVACWLGAAILLHLLARRLGADEACATLAVALMLTSYWGPRFSFHSPCYVEPMMMLFVAGGLLLVERNAHWSLALLVPVALLQRPQSAVLVVCALVRDVQERRLDAGRFASYALMAALVVSSQAILHQAVVPLNAASEPGPVRTALEILEKLVRDPDYALRALLGVGVSLGVMPFVALALPGARRVLVERGWLLALVLFGLVSLLGGVDKARLAFLIAPALVLAIAVGLPARESARAWWMAALLVVFAHALTQSPWIDLLDRDVYLNALAPVHGPAPDAGRIALTLGGAGVVAAGIARRGLRGKAPEGPRRAE